MTVALGLTFVIVLVPVIGLLSGQVRLVPILSGSMEPTIPSGGMLVVTPVPVSEVRAGQVILYRIPIGDRHVEAHRIVRVVSAGAQPVVITKGDANDSTDPWEARLDGPVVWKARFAVPRIGNVIVLLRRSLARALMLGAAVGLLLAVGLRWLWAGAPREEGRRDAART